MLVVISFTLWHLQTTEKCRKWRPKSNVNNSHLTHTYIVSIMTLYNSLKCIACKKTALNQNFIYYTIVVFKFLSITSEPRRYLPLGIPRSTFQIRDSWKTNYGSLASSAPFQRHYAEARTRMFPRTPSSRGWSQI